MDWVKLWVEDFLLALGAFGGTAAGVDATTAVSIPAGPVLLSAAIKATMRVAWNWAKTRKSPATVDTD